MEVLGFKDRSLYLYKRALYRQAISPAENINVGLLLESEYRDTEMQDFLFSDSGKQVKKTLTCKVYP